MTFGKHLLTTGFIALTLGACSSEQAPAPKSFAPLVKVISVGDQGELLARKLPGTVRSSQQVELAFQVQGRLVEFPVKEGQSVEAGELLGRLDDRDYRSAVDAVRADVIKNTSNLSRAKELIEKSFISRVELDRIQADYDVSIANLQRAEKALHDTRLEAPFKGSIAKTYVENFQDVQAKQAMLSLQNKSDLEIVVAVSETLIARQRESRILDLHAEFAALPNHSFELFVKEFSTEADPKTQTFQYVLGVVDKGDKQILPGMTAIVSVMAKNMAADATVTIPLAAVVQNTEGSTSVWVVDKNNTVHRKAITTGTLSGRAEIAVSDGLSAGDMIVTAGLSKLVEGMEVKPMSEVKF